MIMKLKGKVAVVTGASRGIGRAIVKLFADEGAKVVINYNSSETPAKRLAEEINGKGGDAIAVKGDVSDPKQVRALVKEAVERFGRIDILVNNAGILLPSLFPDCTDEIWEKIIAINLKGPFLCSREVADIMLKQGKGKIINISSISGLAYPSALENTPYAISKAGVIGLTRSLAVNLAPTVNVNAICPGLIETDMTASNSPESKRMRIEESLLKRIGKPEEIANAALFLASDESDFVTGEILTVSGGRAMR
jgi:3-oxoacyl-[acyl-carrier protein] reductase